MLKVCVISDTHMQHTKIQLPEADVLIHCGDASICDGKYRPVNKPIVFSIGHNLYKEFAC
jgi:predicted phosphodiesterase